MKHTKYSLHLVGDTDDPFVVLYEIPRTPRRKLTDASQNQNSNNSHTTATITNTNNGNINSNNNDNEEVSAFKVFKFGGIPLLFVDLLFA